MRGSRLLAVVVLALLVGSLLVACGGGSGGGTPDGAVKAMMESMASADAAKAKSVTCAAEQGTIDEQMKQLKDSGVKMDVGGLTYAVKSNDGKTAAVALGGKMKISMLGQTVEMDISELAKSGGMGDLGSDTIKVVNEGGAWKVCGN